MFVEDNMDSIKVSKFKNIDENNENNDVENQSFEQEDNDVMDNIISSVKTPETSETPISINQDDSVQLYLRKIGKLSLLSAQDELQVAADIKSNDKKREKKQYKN